MPPITPFSNVLQYPQQDEQPALPEATIDLPPAQDVSYEDGARKTEQADGSVVVDLSPSTKRTPSDKFTANLAEEMDEADLNRIATDLIEGIDRDNQSRADHLAMIQEGMKLLGLIIESNNASQASSSAPLEGMSTVRHPLLLEACQLFQANAMGELLPAAGPVKIRDDRPDEPDPQLNPFAPPGVASPPPGVGAPGAGSSPAPSVGVQPSAP